MVMKTVDEQSSEYGLDMSVRVINKYINDCDGVEHLLQVMSMG